MPTKRSPRKGSLQFWPRKRAKSENVRVRTWPASKETKVVGFAGYKAGMTHIMIKDNRPNAPTKNEEVIVPVTIIECPPLKVAGAILYKRDAYGLHCAGHALAPSLDKDLARLIPAAKKRKLKLESLKPEEYTDLRLLVHTQPKLTCIGKKQPELFELGIGGSIPEKFEYAKGILGKEITIKDVLNAGAQVDAHAVTKGKGYQGPVKRFGVSIRQHKAEKTKRGPGSLGAWMSARTWTVAHAGQTGYHTRMEHNKVVLAVEDDVKRINPKGGFVRYGEVRNPYILLKGSVPGPKKRLIKFTTSMRPKRLPAQVAPISYISQTSQS